jgi:hypothetical protein
MSKTQDLKMGEDNEIKNVDLISEFLKTELIKDTNKFSIMDWTNKSNTIYVELKSRRFSYKLYPTTIIGSNKINFCNDPTKNYYFVFSFIDGLYYIKYDKELFKDFVVKNMQINYRKDVGYNEINNVVHIPINLLKKIT